MTKISNVNKLAFLSFISSTFAFSIDFKFSSLLVIVSLVSIFLSFLFTMNNYRIREASLLLIVFAVLYNLILIFISNNLSGVISFIVGILLLFPYYKFIGYKIDSMLR